MKTFDILVCDDEESICLLLQEVLAKLGHHVSTCRDGAAALALAQQKPFDLAFLDIRMPGMDGVELLKRLREVCPDATYIMITGFAGAELMEESLRCGAAACLAKPFSLASLIKLLREATEGQPISA